MHIDTFPAHASDDPAADCEPSLMDDASFQRFLRTLHAERTMTTSPCLITAPLRLRSPMPRFRPVPAAA